MLNVWRSSLTVATALIAVVATHAAIDSPLQWAYLTPAAPRAPRAARAAPAPGEAAAQPFVDWFPMDHPPMPDVVASGKPPDVRACGLCHYPNGKGRPENAPVAGLPRDYIVRQLHDFKTGERRSFDDLKEPAKEMGRIAAALSEKEIQEVAKYFSSMPWTPWIRVMEAETIPSMRNANAMYQPVNDGTSEPLGRRIVEAPVDLQATQDRNARSGFIAYVPPGAQARGEQLVMTGAEGRTVPCITCHGLDLRGSDRSAPELTAVPGLAGRSPSYLARQMYDMKQGVRRGEGAALMAPVVANIDEEDILAIVGYLASRAP